MTDFIDGIFVPSLVIEAYFLLSCETVVESGTDLTCGPLDKRAPDGASASGVIGFVQPALEGAALSLSLWLGSKLVLDLSRASASQWVPDPSVA